MRFSSVLATLIFIFILNTNAQLNLTVGEKFLDGKIIKKVFVAVEDHSVWALTINGEVYLKRKAELDFLPYQPTTGLQIDQITGFNENEMFFLFKPDIIIHFKAGIKYEIKVPFDNVTRINDISVVYNNSSSTYYINNPQTVLPDYLAIATNKHLYKLIKGDLSVTIKVPYQNPPVVNEPNWRITNSGYKSVDFQYSYPNYNYCQNSDHITVNFISGVTVYNSALPDQLPNYSAVNCSLIALDWRRYATSNVYNFFGNDKGLFVQTFRNCNDPVKKLIDNETVNDLEEIFALTPIYRQNFVLAATNNGLYFTPRSIFHELYGYRYDYPINFEKHKIFPNEKIYSLCMDTKQESVIDVSSGWVALSVCEKVLWVASSTGVRKVYATLDQDYYNNFSFSEFQYYGIPKNTGDFTKLVFETCGNQKQTITAKIPDVSTNEVLIQWYKDDIEVTDWIGKFTVDLAESGTYKTKITVLCEGISLTSIPIVIINNPGPEITFIPLSNVNVCNSQPYVMETKNVSNYSYQWYKDEVKINAATQFRYSATTTGKYRVEVSNNTCPNFLSSASVNLNFITMAIPSITKDKTGYCIGEMATLTVNNNQGFQTKWYYNGTEINAAANQDKIITGQTGNYRVEFISTDCVNSSIDYPIIFNQLPIANINRSNNKTLCYGEFVELTADDIPGATYLWNTGEKTKKIVVANAGKYSVTVTNSSNCSLKSSEVDIFVNEDLRFQNPIINSTKNDYCIDEMATLKVHNANGLKTRWYMNGMELLAFANQNQITTTTTGKYKVELINSLGCSKSSAEFPITFNNKLIVVINASVNKAICQGESVKLSAGIFPNASYLWSTGEKTETINVTNSGKYSVQVSSEFSCTSISDEIEVKVNPLPSLSNNEQIKICVILKDQVILKAEPGFLYYNWNGKRGINPELVVNQPGLYTLVVEDINGCKANKTFAVIPYCKEIIAPNAFSPNGDGINDLWKVGGLENEPNSSIQIFNRLGTLVFDGRGNNPVWNGNVNNSQAPTGVYYYVITTFLAPQTIKGTITLIR